MQVPPYMIETKYYIKEIEETDRYTAYGNFLDRFRGCDGEGEGRKLQEYIIKDKPIDSNKYPIDTAIPEFKKRKLYLGDNCMSRA